MEAKIEIDQSLIDKADLVHLYFNTIIVQISEVRITIPLTKENKEEFLKMFSNNLDYISFQSNREKLFKLDYDDIFFINLKKLKHLNVRDKYDRPLLVFINSKAPLYSPKSFMRALIDSGKRIKIKGEIYLKEIIGEELLLEYKIKELL